jgi:hypothetical protein
VAQKHGVLGDLQHLASTARTRSAVMLAAVSFSLCHVAVMATAAGPSGVTADLDADIPRQLLHFAAVLCRFLLPLGFMAVGFSKRAKAARSGRPTDEK